MAGETGKGTDGISTLSDPAAAARAKAALARQHELRPGTRAGAYVIKEVLGRGGMGTVYRAVQPVIDGQVAIKVLAPQMSANLEAVERFMREARVVNKIRHAHIVQIFDFGRLDDGGQYCVMELLHGETLKELLARRRPLMLAEAQHVIDSVAQALDAAHAAGVVHRDLKPANIFLVHAGAGRAPLVKLLDFGVAKLIGGAVLDRGGAGESWPSNELKTRLGSALGTPAYMSPEQHRGEAVDHRSDIFSLGMLAFEMIVGRRPSEDELRDLSRSDCPAATRPVLAQALAAKPARRQASAGAFALSLREATRALGDEGPAWQGEGRVAPSGPPPSIARTLTSAAPQTRSGRILRFALLFAVAAASIMLWLTIRPERARDSERSAAADAGPGAPAPDLKPDHRPRTPADARLPRSRPTVTVVKTPRRRVPRKKKRKKRVIRDMPVRFR